MIQVGCMSLYKIVTANKLEVTRYKLEVGGFIAGGPPLLETGDVGELVALLTCIAVLNQRDALYMSVLDLGNKK